jgi:chromosome partitioning protein
MELEQLARWVQKTNRGKRPCWPFKRKKPMARIISFINYKGGVGKTSLVVNVAACLARRGQRVLLIDLDTQSNASIWLMRLERWNKLNVENAGHVYSIFEPGNATLADCVIRDVVEDKDGNKVLPGLDLIPTTFNLVDLESDYASNPSQPHYLIFRQQIAALEANYDFILFDCPPNVLRAAQCGLFSSREIVVPANPDALSLIGFTLFTEKLLRFHQISLSFRDASMGSPALVSGIVFNSIKANVDIEVPKMRMQLRLNQFRAQRKAAPQGRIYETRVRDATIVRRAVTLGLPVCMLSSEVSETDNVATDYDRLSEEILSSDPAALPASALAV